MRGRAPLGLAAFGTAALLGVTGFVHGPPLGTERVVDSAGRPVPGASVAVSLPGFMSGVATRPDGAFRLPAAVLLQPEQIAASAPGYLPARGQRPGRVVLLRRPYVFGRLTDESGTGIDRGVVTVAVGSRAWQTVSDGSGFFSLPGVLDPGHAFVTATAGAHDAYLGELELAGDHSFMVDAAMPRQLGTLIISSDPPGLAPLLDGLPIDGCPATPCSPAVPAGLHTLELTGDLYVPWSSGVSVWEGVQLPIPVTLARKTGTLEVMAPPGAGALLTIDGQAVNGLSWSGTVATGVHSVGYSAGDHWPYLQTVTVDWNKTTTATVASAAISRGDEAGFQAGMRQYLGSLPGQFSAWVAPVAGGTELGFQPTTEMEAASVIKLPLAIYVEKEAQDGKLKMSDQVTLEDDDFMGGTGTLNGNAHSGDKYTIGSLLGLLIQQSDNSAWKALRRALADGAIDAYTGSIGGPDCHQDDDQCTAREAGVMLQALAAGQLLDPAHTKDLMQLLETTAFNDRINAYLGGYVIAHKVGMDGSVMNDTGVVFSGRPFVVSMFTNADPNVGVEAIRQVARLAQLLYG